MGAEKLTFKVKRYLFTHEKLTFHWKPIESLRIPPLFSKQNVFRLGSQQRVMRAGQQLFKEKI
jgi:hypothetical protein